MTANPILLHGVGRFQSKTCTVIRINVAVGSAARGLPVHRITSVHLSALHFFPDASPSSFPAFSSEGLDVSLSGSILEPPSINTMSPGAALVFRASQCMLLVWLVVVVFEATTIDFIRTLYWSLSSPCF
jgi:hypothetical protein